MSVPRNKGKKNPAYSHGFSYRSKPHRIYKIWANMKTRCNNKNYNEYHYYGGRGIKVCDRWQDFLNFYEDMKDGYSPDLSLDRINADGNYCKENCRWATLKEQANNKRNSRPLTFEGKTQNLMDWSKELGIKYSTLSQRFYSYGWSLERTLSTPSKQYKYVSI